MQAPAPTAALAEWLDWLSTLTPNEIELGLDRVSEVLERMRLELAATVVHVAGTNGKGSSVAMLEAIYLQRDASVGSYTSPHLQEFNERIRVGGQNASDEEILSAFMEVERARNDTPLTYFEFTTLAALAIFDRRKVSTCILEIGLGGRLDAVNAVEPDGGIITNIALDHCAWLGEDLESIGFEKAGIMRAEKPFVYADWNPPLTVLAQADETGADLRCLGRDYRFEDLGGGEWQFIGRETQPLELLNPALLGSVQLQNAAGVLALLECLGEHDLLRSDLLNAAFANLQLAGRFEIIERARTWYLDVAHNEAAAAALARSLHDSAVPPVTCVIGVLSDKDIEGVVQPLLPLVKQWVAVSADGDRAVPASEVGRVIANLSGLPCRIETSTVAACQALEAGNDEGGPVLVTGSFMTVAPARCYLQSNAT